MTDLLPPSPTPPLPTDHLPAMYEQAEEGRQDDEQAWIQYVDGLVHQCREGAE